MIPDSPRDNLAPLNFPDLHQPATMSSNTDPKRGKGAAVDDDDDLDDLDGRVVLFLRWKVLRLVLTRNS